MGKEAGAPSAAIQCLSFLLKNGNHVKRYAVAVLFLVISHTLTAQTCTVTNSVQAIPPSSGNFDIFLAAGDSTDYGIRGVLVYDTYDTTGMGHSTAIAGPPYFWQEVFQRSAIWPKSNPLTMTYTVCVNIPGDKTYYIGFAADNIGTLSVDGKTIAKSVDFSYWSVFKVSLTKGAHIVGFSVINTGGPGALGCEIYDNTEDQILNSTSYGDLNVIFTTQRQIGLQVQQANPASSYSCPVGYLLNYCVSEPPVCTQFVPISLKINPPTPACSAAGVDITAPQITAGSPSSLTFTYWKDSLATIPLAAPNNITKSGTYYIMGSANGCRLIKPVNVLVNSTAATINSVICLGKSYAGYKKSGTYVDTLVAANGCDSIRTINLTVVTAAESTQNVALCQGDNYRGHTRSGTYTDTVMTANGCDSLITTNLTVSPNLDLGPDRQLCQGDSIILQPGAFKSYLWQDGSTAAYYKVVRGGVYWVRVTDESGCTGADTVNIKAVNCSLANIPNTFTPNGDGINDTWKINGLQVYPQCTVFVYTRWGQLVFKSTGYAKPWDGRENGRDLPIGTYYYVIDLNDNKPGISGFVTIVR